MGYRATHHTSGQRRYYITPAEAERDLGRGYTSEWELTVDHDPAWHLPNLVQLPGGVIGFGDPRRKPSARRTHG